MTSRNMLAVAVCFAVSVLVLPALADQDYHDAHQTKKAVGNFTNRHIVRTDRYVAHKAANTHRYVAHKVANTHRYVHHKAAKTRDWLNKH